MGRLTEDFTRLVAEINSRHMDRVRLMRDLRHSTADMKRSVSQAMSRFHAARLAQSREQQKRLRGFATSLRETVTGMRAAFAEDLAGAHAAWFGGLKVEARGAVGAPGQLMGYGRRGGRKAGLGPDAG